MYWAEARRERGRKQSSWCKRNRRNGPTLEGDQNHGSRIDAHYHGCDPNLGEIPRQIWVLHGDSLHFCGRWVTFSDWFVKGRKCALHKYFILVCFLYLVHTSRFWRRCGRLNIVISYFSLHPIPVFWNGIDPVFFSFISLIETRPLSHHIVSCISVKYACTSGLSAFGSLGLSGVLVGDLGDLSLNFLISTVKPRSYCNTAPLPLITLCTKAWKNTAKHTAVLVCQIVPPFKTLGWSQASVRPWAW